MSKGKKVVIAVLAAVVALAACLGAFFGVRQYLDGRESFTVQDTLPDGGGRQARVILLAGQSNASGCSRDEYLKKNVSEEKYAEYSAGYDNVYINYYVSGTNVSEGFVKCSVCQGEAGGCFGPELGIAEKLHEENPDELYFIIKYAWGGTNLYEQWLSPSSKGKTGDLYKSFISYVKESMDYLVSKNYDVEIEGMCWMQGESDSFFTEHAQGYAENLSNLIGDVRRKLSRYAAEDGIAFVDAYIADNPVFWVYCDMVNASKDTVAASSPMNVLIDTIAHGLDCTKEPEEAPDIPHYDSLSEMKLGNLFAEELLKFME